MEASKKTYWLRIAIVFALGFLGVLSALPILPKLLMATGQEPPVPMFVLQALSTIQSSVILAAMVMLGAWLSPKIVLGTPVIDAFLNKTWDELNLKKIVVSGTLGGVLGGISLLFFYNFFMRYLPQEFLENAKGFTPPIYTKILYGGITEEVLIRWGLMSFFVWGLFRLTQSHDSKVNTYNYIVGIVVSAIIFGAGHLPAAFMLSSVVTVELVTYIIVGNLIFGLISGYLYWKQGLESAVLAHMLAHVVMILGEQIA